MTGRLAGKVGIVTGAAGAIGGAAARAFAMEGATIGLMDLAGSQLSSLADDIGPAGVRLPCDVSDEDAVAGAVATWSARFDRADFVYVCAGIQLHGADGPVGRVSLSTWNRTLAVNLTGAFLAVKHTVDLLTASGSGSLVLCGSPTGLTMTGGGYAAYAASKAGMMCLARTVAADYQPAVRANVVVPGTTDTPLIADLLADPARASDLRSGTPIGRLGTAADLVGVAIYLVSDESRYATGATFVVDGGLTIR